MNSISLPDIPLAAKTIVASMENKNVLGASRHVRMIIKVLRIISDQSIAQNSEDLIAQLNEVNQYFVQTRGKETVAVQNALNWTTAGNDKIVDKAMVFRACYT